VKNINPHRPRLAMSKNQFLSCCPVWRGVGAWRERGGGTHALTTPFTDSGPRRAGHAAVHKRTPGSRNIPFSLSLGTHAQNHRSQHCGGRQLLFLEDGTGDGRGKRGSGGRGESGERGAGCAEQRKRKKNEKTPRLVRSPTRTRTLPSQSHGPRRDGPGRVRPPLGGHHHAVFQGARSLRRRVEGEAIGARALHGRRAFAARALPSVRPRLVLRRLARRVKYSASAKVVEERVAAGAARHLTAVLSFFFFFARAPSLNPHLLFSPSIKKPHRSPPSSSTSCAASSPSPSSPTLSSSSSCSWPTSGW
jgi:hypothetical protein